MNIELTSQSIRTMADRVTKAYPDTSKPKALEMLAVALGYRNFDTLSGMLKKAPTKLASFASFDLYFAMRATDEWAPEPVWAKKQITPAFVEKLKHYVEQCKAAGLSSMRVDCTQVPDMELDDWDDGKESDPFNVHYWTLTVTPTRFWYSATPKHAEYEVETRALYLDDLQRLIDNAGDTDSVSRHGNTAFVSSVDVLCFVDQMIDHVWKIDLEDALAWATGYLISIDDVPDLTTNDERTLCVRYHFEANQEKKRG